MSNRAKSVLFIKKRSVSYGELECEEINAANSPLMRLPRFDPLKITLR